MKEEDILRAIRELKKAPTVDCTEYRKKVNAIALKESIAFKKEEDNLRMSSELFNRPFTI